MAAVGREALPAGARAPRPALAVLVIVALLVAVPVLFGDRLGFEGDGLAFLFGMNRFEELGRAGVYRYHWQPLAYELLARLAPLLPRPFALTYVGQLLGGLGLALWFLLLRRLLQPWPQATLLALALALCITELWVTPLYFNPTAMGLPFIAAGLLAAHRGAGGAHALRWGVAGGALLATGCLFRLDYLAILPFVFTLLACWYGGVRRAGVLGFAGGGLLVAAALFAAQPHFLREAAAILELYGSGEHDITMLYRAKILLFAIGPGWLVLPLLWWAGRRGGACPPGAAAWNRARWALLALALLPTLLPLKNLYSGKYLIPFFLCLLLLLAQWLSTRAPAAAGTGVGEGSGGGGGGGAPRWRGMAWAARAALGLLGLLWIVGVPDAQALRQRPLAAWVADPLVVGTHDGMRPAGAFLGFLRQMDEFRLPQDSVRFYRELSQAVAQCGTDLTVLMSPVPQFGHNPWSWGWLPLYLMQEGWQLVDYHAGESALLVKPGAGTQVRILASDRRASAAGAGGVLDLAGIGWREDYFFWTQARQWLRRPDTRAVCAAPA